MVVVVRWSGHAVAGLGAWAAANGLILVIVPARPSGVGQTAGDCKKSFIFRRPAPPWPCHLVVASASCCRRLCRQCVDTCHDNSGVVRRTSVHRRRGRLIGRIACADGHLGGMLGVGGFDILRDSETRNGYRSAPRQSQTAAPVERLRRPCTLPTVNCAESAFVSYGIG